MSKKIKFSCGLASFRTVCSSFFEMERVHGPAFSDQTEYFRIFLRSPLSSLKICPLNFITSCSLRYYKMGDVTFSKMGWCLRATGMPFRSHCKVEFLVFFFLISSQCVCVFYDMAWKCW